MGDMADHYIDIALEHPEDWEPEFPKKKEFIWTTREGKRIPLSKIKDDHLDNIIPHLKRRMDKQTDAKKIKAYLRVLQIMIGEKEKRSKWKNKGKLE